MKDARIAKHGAHFIAPSRGVVVVDKGLADRGGATATEHHSLSR